QNESTWESFTATFQNTMFFKLVEKITGNQAGSGGYITLKNSNWLLSIVLPRQPHFINQPDNAYVCWGYGLFSDKKGNYITKKMSECAGEEILIELCQHLGFKKEMPLILKTSNCIPCLMPYITSQFLPRKKGDRPSVAPERLSNMAFIGQFCEIPEEISFTVEYSVRSAQLAVISLLKLNKKATPIYKGQYNLKVLYNTLKTILFA
ncbi:MAG: oleate hydratase, partial [Patescibacteria group bacterium]